MDAITAPAAISGPSTTGDSPPPRFLPLLLLLFVGSGCAALIYEIVWFQLLQLVIGSSAVSLAVLLGTFMGGMCLGSLALPRFISAQKHPLRVYALIELGIALAGIVVLFAVPAIGRLYTSMVGHGMPGILLRAVVCAICLLPPTVLMGATLPAIARWIESTPRGVAWLGFFYGGNTFGAVAGCVLAGFYLLRVHDMATATWCAVALNVVVAGVALVLAKSDAAPSNPTQIAHADDLPSVPGTNFIFCSIALSGLCALAAEVVWARTLSLLLGATVYTFSIILAVFLAGLGLGSSVGAMMTRGHVAPRVLLGACQILQAAALAWAAYVIAVALPQWPVDSSLRVTPWARFQFDVVRCAWAILPSALLWGASFPLALASVARRGHDTARLVGRAYAANTLGAIAGAVGASMLLIPQLGTQQTQQVLMALTVASAVIVFVPRRRAGPLLALGAATAVLLLVPSLPRIPWQLVAYGRQIATTDYGAHSIYFGEGMNSSVAVSETPGGARFFHVSGKTEASSLEKDMRLQRMLGHIPALLHPNPKSVLIVGCGAGITAGTFVIHPSIERIVICDIEPLIPGVVAAYFNHENHGVVHDKRVQIVHDDARHFIATTREKFDIITSDPIHPWVKGSAVLYSQEYFQLCRERLNPGGLVTQWVPLYESDRAVVQSEIATFFSVFPHATIWANDDDGAGYDTVMLGQPEPLQVDVDTLQQRLEHGDYVRVRDALTGLGLGSATGLLSTYAGRRDDLKSWLAPAEINRDRNLRLQYLAGLQLNATSGTGTYHEIVSHRRFPEDLFHASEGSLETLRRSLAAPQANP
ncbi:MAG TPA: fused MFS/spermidine synthase [Opitutaceae bacterium]|nr:fused MFS/spermidine synthase [Opitutaceae bacterium]